MLVDTDVMVDVLRGYLPAVTWMELLDGCRNLAEQQRVERKLQRFSMSWPTLADCQTAYKDFAAYHLSHGVDVLDMLIGHTALGRNESLATFNIKHYGVIGGLQTIQPY